MTRWECNVCCDRKTIIYEAKPWDDNDSPEIEQFPETPCPACTGTHYISAPVGTLLYLAQEYFHETEAEYADRSRLSSLFESSLHSNNVRTTIRATTEMREAWEQFLEDSRND